MAAKKEIAEHLKIALSEIGDIEPWFDKAVDCWVFSHKNYPVEYGGETKEEVIKKYPKYLREFIAQRLKKKVSSVNERETKGWGGVREGSGRPLGSKGAYPTVQIRVPEDIANWLRQPMMMQMIRQMLEGYGKSAHEKRHH